MHKTAEHVTVVDPHLVAETMHARHKQAQIEAAVKTWVDVTDEQSIKDFKKVNEALNVSTDANNDGLYTINETEIASEGDYRATTVNVTIENEVDVAYEDIGMVELARKLGEAERNQDRSVATEISGVILEKIEESANKHKLSPEAQEALLNRLMKVAYGSGNRQKDSAKKSTINTSLPSGLSAKEQSNGTDEGSKTNPSVTSISTETGTDKDTDASTSAANELAVPANVNTVADAETEVDTPQDEDYDKLFSEASSEILKARQQIQEAKRSGDQTALAAAITRAEQAYAAYDVLMGTETAQSFMSNWLDSAAAQVNGESVVDPNATNNAAAAEQQSNPAPVSPEDIADELRAMAAAGGADRSTYFAKLEEYAKAYYTEQQQAGIDFDSEEQGILDARLNGLISLWEQGPETAAGESVNDEAQESFDLSFSLRVARDIALDAGRRFRDAAANGNLEEAEKAVEMARTAAYDLQRLEEWSPAQVKAENLKFHSKYGVWLFDEPANEVVNNSNNPNQVIAVASAEANQGADEYQAALDSLLPILFNTLKNNNLEDFKIANDHAAELINEKAAQEGWDEVQTAEERQRFIDAFNIYQEQVSAESYQEPVPARRRSSLVRAAFKKVRDFKNRNLQTTAVAEEVENTSDVLVVVATNAPDAQQVTSEQDQPEERKKNRLVYFAIGALGLVGAALLMNLDRSDIDDKRSNTAGTSLTIAPQGGQTTTAPERPAAPQSAKEKLTANDAIWHHAEANLKKAGIVNPTVEQIDALKDRILLNNGLSEEDAKKLPVGYEFKV